MTLPIALGLPTNGLEWMFVFIVVLLLFGAKRLPELAKGLGRSLHEFKKAREDFETEIHRAHTPTPNLPITPPLTQPIKRQLSYNGAEAAGEEQNAANTEQQIRALQEQLQVLAQQNAELRAATGQVNGTEA